MAGTSNTKMRTGNLRFIIKLQEKVKTGTSTSGAPQWEWQDRPSARCSIDPASLTMIAAAKETILAGAQNAFDMKIIEMHVRPEIQPLTWRAVYGPTIYDINAVRPTNRVDRMRLFCTVGASNG